jgi:hypothetical protein
MSSDYHTSQSKVLRQQRSSEHKFWPVNVPRSLIMFCTAAIVKTQLPDERLKRVTPAILKNN